MKGENREAQGAESSGGLDFAALVYAVRGNEVCWAAVASGGFLFWVGAWEIPKTLFPPAVCPHGW